MKRRTEREMAYLFLSLPTLMGLAIILGLIRMAFIGLGVFQ